MPRDTLSERDRLRLAELIKTSREKPPAPGDAPTKRPMPMVPRFSARAASKIRELWSAGNWDHKYKSVQRYLASVRDRFTSMDMERRSTLLKRHFATHWREWATGAAVMILCLAILGLAVKLQSRPASPSIQFQAMERDGQLR